ncbi:MAG: GNAT family N-acetyltransferase [Chryseolinea sp.]
MDLFLHAIKERLSDNAEFARIPVCAEHLAISVAYHASLGYSPPWIGYYASLDNIMVGAAAFKGRPINGRVEIAYGTFENQRQKGIGTAICRTLVQLALRTDPSVVVTARTLMEENASCKILRKNGFVNKGIVTDADDGDVWEWVYDKG